MKTNCTITDKDGKVTDYVWDDQQKIMVEGKEKGNSLVAITSNSRRIGW